MLHMYPQATLTAPSFIYAFIHDSLLESLRVHASQTACRVDKFRTTRDWRRPVGGIDRLVLRFPQLCASPNSDPNIQFASPPAFYCCYSPTVNLHHAAQIDSFSLSIIGGSMGTSGLRVEKSTRARICCGALHAWHLVTRPSLRKPGLKHSYSTVLLL